VVVQVGLENLTTIETVFRRLVMHALKKNIAKILQVVI